MPGDSCLHACPVAGQLLVLGGAAHPLDPMRLVPERDLLLLAWSSVEHTARQSERQVLPWVAPSSGLDCPNDCYSLTRKARACPVKRQH